MERIVEAQLGKLNSELYYNSDMSDITGMSNFFNVVGRRGDSQIVKVKIIEDTHPKFINLFGVCIDLETGNIALGLTPLKSQYIYVGNFKNVLTKVWFNNDKSIVSTLDIKYYLNLLKLDPLYYVGEIYDDIISQLTNSKISSSTSLSGYYVKLLHSHELSKSLEHFTKLYKKGKLISVLANALVEMYLKLQDLANNFYHNFITEQYNTEVVANYGKTFKGIMSNHNNPYVEALTIRYMKYNFPIVFLNALKSYGHCIKERKNLFNLGMRLSSYSSDDITDIGVALSSGYYARKVIKKELILAYNFMDLLIACGWDQNLLVSLEIIVEQRNLNVWKALLNKFNIYDILEEQKLVEKEFVLGIDDYRNNRLIHIDTGTCYKRQPCMNQYNLVSFAPYQICKAGEVLEETFGILLKGMNFS